MCTKKSGQTQFGHAIEHWCERWTTSAAGRPRTYRGGVRDDERNIGRCSGWNCDQERQPCPGGGAPGGRMTGQAHAMGGGRKRGDRVRGFDGSPTHTCVGFERV